MPPPNSNHAKDAGLNLCFNPYPPLPPRQSPSNANAWLNDRLPLSDLHEVGRGTEQRPVRYVSPPFQRVLRWTPERRCAYLQSMFMGEPQTPLVLWRPDGANYTLVLDGQHRLASLACSVEGSDGQFRVLDDVRFNLRTLEWEPGTTNNGDTLSAERLCKPHHHRWLNNDAVAINGEAWWEQVCAVGERLHRQNPTPVLLSTDPETPAAWREAVSFFVRMARSVPFTEVELEAMTAYAERMGEAPTP
jgi:hypothetical protein